jgi:hypothetical protein
LTDGFADHFGQNVGGCLALQVDRGEQERALGRFPFFDHGAFRQRALEAVDGLLLCVGLGATALFGDIRLLFRQPVDDQR